jgi:Protein of unknown function (DUF4230)
MQKIYFSLLVTLLLSCNTKDNLKSRKEIFAFKEMSDVATVEYTLSKVVKANDNSTWYKFGNRKIVMSVMAYAKAGIDLSAVTDEKVTITNNNVNIVLPHAKLINLNIPPEEIKEETTDVGTLRWQYNNDEKNSLLIQAEESIRKSIDSIGIIKKAEENATTFISNFIKRLGYNNVTISFDSIPTK